MQCVGSIARESAGEGEAKHEGGGVWSEGGGSSNT